jgi:hypothetical protein
MPSVRAGSVSTTRHPGSARSANGSLRDEMPADDAGAVLWTLASPEVHRSLTVGCAWSNERFELWLRQMLTAALLP